MIAFFFDYSSDEHNEQFEDFIRKWEDMFYKREFDCDDTNSTEYNPVYRQRSEEEMINLWGDERDWPGNADYDIYMLLPTIYYYGYVGSGTTPPCSRDVIWRILDLPMNISHDQFLRIQRIILDQRDEKCRRNSKAYNGGVNRPIQKTTQSVYHCSAQYWSPRHHELWCGKWPKEYHGKYKLKKYCAD